jgi:uncharacterized membrane protein
VWRFAQAVRVFTQAAAGFLGLAAAASAGEPCHYTYQVVAEPPGGEFTTPMAINNLGHVTGYMEYNGAERGFLWTPEGGTQLLPWPAGVIRMQATGINDVDHICGWVDWSTFEVNAFLWDGNEFTFIPSPYPNTRIEAHDVNNSDQVVGTVYTSPLIPFLWEKGVLTDLYSLIGAPQPHMVAINDDGVMAGHGGEGSITHAWVLDGHGIRWLPENGLVDTGVSGLSNSADVVGWGLAIPNGYASGVVWDEPALYTVAPPRTLPMPFAKVATTRGE